jgi:hypothetical protein
MASFPPGARWRQDRTAQPSQRMKLPSGCHRPRYDCVLGHRGARMAEFFTSGRVADLVLLVLVLESAALVLWHRRTGRGLPPAAVLGLALPGVALVLALRAALVGAGWPFVAMALVGAFAAHLFDLAFRLRR